MHEMTLAESVLQIVENAARREGLRRVRAVRLEIGQLSSVEPEAMRFCFDAVARDSVADGARLDIVVTAGAAWCVECSERVALPELGAARRNIAELPAFGPVGPETAVERSLIG